MLKNIVNFYSLPIKKMTTEMATFKIMGINDMQNRYNDFAEFSKSILKEKLDYGVIP